MVQDIATMPLSTGGMGEGVGLRSATRPSHPAFWARLADSHAMIRARHPDVGAALQDAKSATRNLIGVEGFEPPSWETLANGQRPPDREPDDFEPCGMRHGSQHEAASRTERKCSPTWQTTSRHHCDPRTVLNRIDSHPSEFLCSDVFASSLFSLSLSLHVSVAVAVLLMILAAIELHMRERVFWEGGVSQ